MKNILEKTITPSEVRASNLGDLWAFTRAVALEEKIAAAEAEHARTIRAPQNSYGFYNFANVCWLHFLMSSMAARNKIREIIFAGPKNKRALKALNATLKQCISSIQKVLDSKEIPDEWNARIPDLTFFDGDLSDVMAACDLRGKSERSHFLHGASEALHTITAAVATALRNPAHSGGEPVCGTGKGTDGSTVDPSKEDQYAAPCGIGRHPTESAGKDRAKVKGTVVRCVEGEQ